MVSLRIGRPVTGSVLVVVTGLVLVVVVEMVVNVPAATANEVDRERDRHCYREQDHMPRVGEDFHDRKARRRDRAGETPVRGILRVPIPSTPVPLAGDSAGRDAGVGSSGVVDGRRAPARRGATVAGQVRRGTIWAAAAC